MQTYPIIALSLITTFVGVQATPSLQISRRSYGPTPSYLHEVPKATQPVYHPKPQHTVYTPKPKLYQPPKVYTHKPKVYHQPKVYASENELYQPKQKVYTPKQGAYIPKQENYQPERELYQPEPEVYHPQPTIPIYSHDSYISNQPMYVKAYSKGY
ncbi:hypothetical protein DSO57_1010244 [Entomophthora muscae]|uniref:Uncharacterized protein n=1 Tax=Entomophthora muscae TaxID=34485 RepID=A0ACC2RXP1_9FUNG|nr:hypothetical protein DSO57_1010244 [Entomophthora muscae]